MSRNAKVSAGLVALSVAVIVAIAFMASGRTSSDDDSGRTTDPVATDAAGPAPRVVNDDPRRLGSPGRSGVTFTEFLDFECESCRAAYPAIEQLRRTYAGRVTFNIRYFPIPSHRNARPAAIAVEAAAQQGRLEPMYRRMYETQGEWGEKSEPQASVFRGFARDLGLDMARFDASVADPTTLRRVEADFNAGTELGVQGTPSFFIDERRIEPQSLDELRDEIEAALAGS